ncbi:MAG: hypothetical protein RJA44_283 [Pseudomonadota bacterium]|jgi:CspA family cold shock protein
MGQIGVVKWFNDVKGFGFIEPEGGGEDIFAHYSAIQMDGFRTLRQGSQVSFDVVDGPKGKLAQNICAVDSHHPAAIVDAAAALGSAPLGLAS